MTVRINTGNPFRFAAGDKVSPLRAAGEVVVAVDPSKSNMAVVIATPNRQLLSVLQFSAPGRDNDNSVYCQDFKDFLRRYLSGVTLFDVGIEKAILKKGMEYYYSSMCLTEIRAALIDLFLSGFKTRPLEVNNHSWKAAILPEHLRTRSTGKGSTKLFPEMYRTYGSDDVTDAFCVMLYLTLDSHKTYNPLCDRAETPLFKPKITLLPKQVCGLFQARFNPRFSLTENAVFYTNRYPRKIYFDLPVSSLSAADVYACETIFYSVTDASEIGAVVWRG
jgi:hypothetical protein